jgi:phosphoglycolate phosphatase
MIRNIIFDWSGVIKDSVENQLLIVNKIFKQFGALEITLEELKENWVQPYMLFYNKYLPNLSHEDEEVAYRKAVMESPKCKPFPWITELLRDFKAREIKMIVLSSGLSETLLPEMADFGLEDVFIEIRTHVYHKLEAIEELVIKNNFKKEETIFIGDSNHEIEEGKNAGVKTGAVTWGYCTKAKLESLKPDFVLNNLEELKQIILI